MKPKANFVIIAGLLLGLLFLGTRMNAEQSRTEVFHVFNTVGRITLYGKDSENWDNAIRELIASMQELHNCINVYDASSQLSCLNAAASEKPFVCSDLLWKALLAARQAYEESEGTFDVTIGPLMQVWGFHNKRNTVPSKEEIDGALAKVGFPKVRFDDTAHSVTFTVPGMTLDLGGMAKGYACGLGADIMRKHGIEKYLLDLGGNLMLSPKTPKGQKAFNIGIRNPQKNHEIIRTIGLRGVAVATSGNYERSRIIDGRKVGHIMDPGTGQPCDFLAGVTVITPMGLRSDVFSTSVFVGGKALAEKLSAKYPGTGFIIISDNGVEEVGSFQ